MAQRIEITPLMVDTLIVYSGLDDIVGAASPEKIILDVAKLEVDSVPLTHILPYEARNLVNGLDKPMTVDQFRKKNDGTTNSANALIQSRIRDNSTVIPRTYWVAESKTTILAAINA